VLETQADHAGGAPQFSTLQENNPFSQALKDQAASKVQPIERGICFGQRCSDVLRAGHAPPAAAFPSTSHNWWLSKVVSNPQLQADLQPSRWLHPYF